MHPEFFRAVRSLGIERDVRNLTRAAEFSEKTLSECRSALRARIDATTDDLDVVVCGSLARREATPESDFDFFVVSHGLPKRVRRTRDALEAVYDLIPKTATGMRPPGPTGIFGRVVAAQDLTERIGLEQDTNLSTTRRILLLEESASVLRPDLHRPTVSNRRPLGTLKVAVSRAFGGASGSGAEWSAREQVPDLAKNGLVLRFPAAEGEEPDAILV